MNTIIKLQVPIDKNVRDKLKNRADKLGFDSVQAYIRFWAKTETEGRHVDFGEDVWGEPTPEAVARINKISTEAKQNIAAKKLKTYTSVNEMMKHLNNL